MLFVSGGSPGYPFVLIWLQIRSSHDFFLRFDLFLEGPTELTEARIYVYQLIKGYDEE